MFSSTCSNYRYEIQGPFFIHRKPPEFSWFSTALKNIITKKLNAGCCGINHSSFYLSAATMNKNDEATADQKETGKSTESQEGRVDENHTLETASFTSSNLNSSKPQQESKEDDFSGKLKNGAGSKSRKTADDAVASNTFQSISCSSEAQRKSLTAKYLEKKNQVKKAIQTETPEEEPLSNGYVKSPEDDGRVRLSLLSLVMDEDVPELMEAMAEKLEFVFEDLPPSISSACEGILRSSTARIRQRSKDTKLKFHASPPTVFTYPDEDSAISKAQWEEGEQINFKIYQELCQREKKHSANESYELGRLLRPSRTNSSNFPFLGTASLLEEPSMAESLLGVTGRISYNSVPVDLTRLGDSANLSLIAGK